MKEEDKRGHRLIDTVTRSLVLSLVFVSNLGLSFIMSVISALDVIYWLDVIDEALDSVKSRLYSAILGYDIRFRTRQRGSSAVLVTGASRGIGAYVAVTLAEQGYVVFAGVADIMDGQNLKRFLTPAAQSQLIPVQLDITNQKHISSAADAIQFHLCMHSPARHLFAVINCDGQPLQSPIETVRQSDWMHLFVSNTIGPMVVVQAMLPLLRQSHGRIINLSSVSSLTASPMNGAFAATKSALESATDALRVEVHRFGIAVSLVIPGSVDLTFLDGFAYQEPSNGSVLHKLTIPDKEAQLYAPLIDSIETITSNEPKQQLVSPEHVTMAILHALTSPFPKTRYVVGIDAKLTQFLRTVFPDRLLDWGYHVLIKHSSV